MSASSPSPSMHFVGGITVVPLTKDGRALTIEINERVQIGDYVRWSALRTPDEGYNFKYDKDGRGRVVDLGLLHIYCATDGAHQQLVAFHRYHVGELGFAIAESASASALALPPQLKQPALGAHDADGATPLETGKRWRWVLRACRDQNHVWMLPVRREEE